MCAILSTYCVLLLLYCIVIVLLCYIVLHFSLAIDCRQLSLDQAKLLSRLEEEFQLEIWGVVEGGHDMDRLNNSASLGAAGTFFNLLHSHESLQLLLEMWKEHNENLSS